MIEGGVWSSGDREVGLTGSLLEARGSPTGPQLADRGGAARPLCNAGLLAWDWSLLGVLLLREGVLALRALLYGRGEKESPLPRPRDIEGGW